MSNSSKLAMKIYLLKEQQKQITVIFCITLLVYNFIIEFAHAASFC